MSETTLIIICYLNTKTAKIQSKKTSSCSGDAEQLKEGSTMTFHINYRLYKADKVRFIDVVAKSKFDAYNKATFEAIPEKEGEAPYSVWVVSCTYGNGNYRRFNTIEGKPY